MTEEKVTILNELTDEELYGYIAERLKKGFRKKYRSDFRHGGFNFVFHNGRFVGVEEKLRHRAYWVSAKGQKVSVA